VPCKAHILKTSLVALVFALVFCGALVAEAIESNLTVQVLSEFQLAGTGPQSPYGRLVQGTNGDFYGTTYAGGISNYGTIFKITSSGTLTTLFSFSRTNGANPYYGGLMRASDGNFYGNCYSGGASNFGTIFKITHEGVFSNLVSLRSTNGSFPQGWLTQSTDGNFYGTTFGGGTSNFGTIYRMTPGGALTSLFFFKGTNGWNPSAGLTLGGDGNFYGTTFSGGANDFGTVFRFSTNGGLTLLVSFTGTNGSYLGGSPRASLVAGSDGQLYGTTEGGGPADAGTVFRITTNGTFANLFNFNGTNGYDPQSALVEGVDGNFYGTTYGTYGGPISFGANSNGTVFAISPAGALQTVVSFDFTNGPGPIGTLALADDGHFYGTTLQGGYDGVGVVFRLVPAPVITAITASSGSVTLVWSAFSNGLYRVESKAPISSAGWSNLVPNVLSIGSTASKTDTPGGTERYYRVTLLP